MTVSSTINREQYATNGVTTAFTIHFPFFNDTDVNAIFVDAGGVETALALGADFSVSGGAGAGGALTTAGAMSPLASGGTLTLYREIPFTQEDDYVEDDPLPADTLEGGFDRAAMRDQQLKDAQDRALTFPVTVAAGVSGELPIPVADDFLRFSSDGLSIVASPIAGLGAVGQATESIAGIAKIATQPITDAGTNDTDALTPKKLANSAQLAARDPRGKHMVAILASAMQPATTSGAASGTVETTTNKLLYKCLDYDQTNQEFAGITIPWPKSSNEGTISFRARWTSAGGTPGQGVAIAMEAVGISDDDALDVAYGTAVQVTDVLLALGDLHVTAESGAVTISGLAEGDLVAIRVKRVPADAADTMTSDLRLIAIDLFLTTNAATDA
jgi:hypothetical protein